MANIKKDVPEIYNCSYCNETFIMSVNQRHNYRQGVKNFYCCKECSYSSRVGHKNYNQKDVNVPINGKCNYCDKDIILTNTQRKRIKKNKNYKIYCTKECADKGKIIKIIKQCKICQNNFTVTASQEYKTICSEECRLKSYSGENNNNWKGGKIVSKDGYVYIYSPNHPNKNSNKYVLEHRLIMEKHIGRYLTNDEIVHHKDGIKNNNVIENLQIMTNEEHVKFHYENGDYKLNGVT